MLFSTPPNYDLYLELLCARNFDQLSTVLDERKSDPIAQGWLAMLQPCMGGSAAKPADCGKNCLLLARQLLRHATNPNLPDPLPAEWDGAFKEQISAWKKDQEEKV